MRASPVRSLVAYEDSTVWIAAQRFLYTDRMGSVILSTDRDGNNVSIGSYDGYGIMGTTNPDGGGRRVFVALG